MGDYGTIIGMSTMTILNFSASVSSDYSVNGDYCIKLIPSENEPVKYFRFRFNEISELIGNTIKFSIDIKNDHSLSLKIYSFNGETFTSQSTSIPSNSEGSFNVQFTTQFH